MASLFFLLWLIATPFVGFVLAGDQAFDLGARGDWEVWKAAVIGGVLAIPFVVGAYFGLRAALQQCSSGWVGFVANTVLAVLAIGMPIFEALTNWHHPFPEGGAWARRHGVLRHEVPSRETPSSAMTVETLPTIPSTGRCRTLHRSSDPIWPWSCGGASMAGRAGLDRSGTAASSRCPRARRCGSARRTGRRYRTSRAAASIGRRLLAQVASQNRDGLRLGSTAETRSDGSPAVGGHPVIDEFGAPVSSYPAMR
jgi:hypothetical protein